MSPPAVGLLVGTAAGLADALFVHLRGSRGLGRPISSLPVMWIAIVVVSATLCALAGLVFAHPRFHRFRAVAIAAAGPGIILLARGGARLSGRAGLPLTFLAVVLATVIVAVPISRLRPVPVRHAALWTALLLVSGSWIVASAAGMEPLRLFRRAEPTRSPAPLPNVALIFLDAGRFDDALGPEGVMPSLARFAAGSVSFENAWAPAPWTDPTHRAVFTGVDPWSSRAADGGTPIAALFRRRGYATGAVFANPRLSSQVSGFDSVAVSGGSAFCRSAVGSLLIRATRYGLPQPPLCGVFTAADVTWGARRFIRSADAPWFLALNYMDAHNPYYVPRDCRPAGFEPVAHSARMRVVSAVGGRRQSPPQLRAAVHEQYRAAMRCMDRALGALLQELSADPHTIVIVLGDHGEQFAEHGFGGHANTLYRQVLHVPLVVHTSGLSPVRETAPVSVSDLHATLLQLLEPHRVAGRIRLLDAPRRRAAISYLDYRGAGGGPHEIAFSAVDPEWHLIAWKDGRQLLFHYRTDPEEKSPVPPQTQPQVVARLQEMLRHARDTQRGGTEFDALGYLQ